MFVAVHTAINGPLKEMQQGCRPNADSYNCIIMVRPCALPHSMLYLTPSLIA